LDDRQRAAADLWLSTAKAQAGLDRVSPLIAPGERRQQCEPSRERHDTAVERMSSLDRLFGLNNNAVQMAPAARVRLEMGAAIKRPLGIVLLAGTFLVAGLAGIAAFWGVLPRTSDTSPLAALFVLMWSCTCVVTAALTWRRSRLAPLSFLAAIGLLLFPALFLFPEGQLSLPSFMVIVSVGFLGYLYLRREHQRLGGR